MRKIILIAIFLCIGFFVRGVDKVSACVDWCDGSSCAVTPNPDVTCDRYVTTCCDAGGGEQFCDAGFYACNRLANGGGSYRGCCAIGSGGGGGGGGCPSGESPVATGYVACEPTCTSPSLEIGTCFAQGEDRISCQIRTCQPPPAQSCLATEPTNLYTVQTSASTAQMNWAPGNKGLQQLLRFGTNFNDVSTGCYNGTCVTSPALPSTAYAAPDESSSWRILDVYSGLNEK